MFRIIANLSLGFGLGYMFAKSEPPSPKNNIYVLEKNSKDIQNRQVFDRPDQNRQVFDLPIQLLGPKVPDQKEQEKTLYHKHKIIYDEKGRAVYYGAP